MRPSSILYLLGMLLVFIGERVFGGESVWRQVADGAGLLLVVGGLISAARAMGAGTADQRSAHRQALIWGAVGLSSLLVYALGTDTVVDALHLADEKAEKRYTVIISALWAVVWLAGTLPFLFVDRVLAVSPEGKPGKRVADAAGAGLSLALAIALVFPANYLGTELNKRWDFGYFKTATAGTATLNLIESLDQPISVYLFFPGGGEVVQELRAYFDPLPTSNLTVQYVDHALEPELAKDLKVRDNGFIVIVRGEGDDRQIERLKIGADFDGARSKLKKLDGEFRESLLKVARGKRTAYFTVGHGELFWTGSDRDPSQKNNNLKQILDALNYKVKELGLTQGLANEVPEDADIVFVLGATTSFLPEELAALDRYRARGGRLLIGLEPGGPDMAALLAPMGLSYDPAITLANDTNFIPATQKLADRANVFTNKYSTHDSVTTLSRNSKVLYFITPTATDLEELADAPGKRTVTVRSLPETFGDTNTNLTFDDGAEKRKTWNLAITATGPITAAVKAEPAPAAEEPAPAAEPAKDAKADGKADGKDAKKDEKKDDKKIDPATEYRAIVVADAGWASDIALPLDPNKANFQFVIDSIAYLLGEEALAGSTNSEEDVKIEHTKEGQGVWFVATSFLVPVGIFLGALLRIRLRRKGGAA